MIDTFMGVIFLGIICILLLLAYVYTLVRQAKKKEWVWFVLTLLFGPVMAIYWIVEIFS